MNFKGFYSSYPVRKSFLRKRIIFDCARGNVVQLTEGHESWGSSPSKSYDIIRLGPPTFQGVNGSRRCTCFVFVMIAVIKNCAELTLSCQHDVTFPLINCNISNPRQSRNVSSHSNP